MANNPPAPQRTPKMGIWILYDPVIHSRRDWTLSSRSQAQPGVVFEESPREEFTTTFIIGKEGQCPVKVDSQREPQFLSNPEIRQAIQRERLEESFHLGEATLIRINRSTARWKSFFPFQKFSRPVARDAFANHGIAQLLELRVLLHVQKHFPGIKTIQHARPFLWERKDPISGMRREQIDKRGLGETYSLARMIRLLRWKIARDTLRHRSETFVQSDRGKKILRGVEARDPRTFMGRMRSRARKAKQWMQRLRRKKK